MRKEIFDSAIRFAGDSLGQTEWAEYERLCADDKRLRHEADKLQAERKRMDDRILALESVLHYSDMLDAGADEAQVLAAIEQDLRMFGRSLAYKKTFNGLRDGFFGYPGNLNADSPLTARLRAEEAEMYYSNNCGDPYESGNVSMDGKEFEREILKLFYRKFGVDAEQGWGYVTSGGTESNLWGIRNGFLRYPNGRLYFSEAAHYSVEKAVTNGEKAIYPYAMIPASRGKTEKVDRMQLLDTVTQNYKQHGEPAILLLTWGTTKLGSLDDIAEITSGLKREGIPYYLHVDAAFYGGVPVNQIEAPVCPTLDALGADSVSVSFHKFFGVPTINSIVIAKDKVSGKDVSYLGTRDTTVSGSRTFPTFSAYQRIREILERSPADYYIRNVRIFEGLLLDAGLFFFRDGDANIFVIPRPSEKILLKYQLPVFEDENGQNTLAHIIVNPFHRHEDFIQIVEDLKADHR